jgi:hypothetical protein
LLIAVVSVLWAPPAHAGSRTFVEMGDTGGRVDDALVRRLIRLELGDVSVPENPRFPGDRSEDVVLYCRVAPEDGALLVEVWERGDAAGARRVSLQGSSQLVARRVALAAAELARRLARDRNALQRRMEREARAEEQRARDEARRAEQRRLALSARAVGVAFFEGAYLVGPELGMQLNHEYPLRIEMGLRWLGGSVSALSPSAGWSAAEFSLTPAYVFPKTAWDLVIRAPLTATMLHLNDGVSVDDISGEHDTWTARAGLGVAVQPRVSSHLRLDMGLSAGMVLRPVPLARIQDGEDELERFGGGFAELTLGVLLD